MKKLIIPILIVAIIVLSLINAIPERNAKAEIKRQQDELYSRLLKMRLEHNFDSLQFITRKMDSLNKEYDKY